MTPSNPREVPAVHHADEQLVRIGEQLAATARHMRFRCMLARLPLPDEGELAYSCTAGRVTVRNDAIRLEPSERLRPCE